MNSSELYEVRQRASINGGRARADRKALLAHVEDLANQLEAMKRERDFARDQLRQANKRGDEAIEIANALIVHPARVAAELAEAQK